MTNRFRTFAGGTALLAATSLALPAQAAPLPVRASASSVHGWTVDDETVHGHRYRGWGRRDNSGDILAGILILGGAVAVLKAAERSRERRDRDGGDWDGDGRYPDSRYPDARYRDRPGYDGDYDDGAGYRDRGDSRDGYAGRGIDGAVEDCVAEVERSERVGSVDTADRTASGWKIAGDLAKGGRYSCSFGSDGRVRDIQIDGDRAGTRDDNDAWRDDDSDWGESGQRDDDYYASARERIGETQPAWDEVGDEPAAAPANQRAETQEDRTWERGEADDRYDTAKGPDYASVN